MPKSLRNRSVVPDVLLATWLVVVVMIVVAAGTTDDRLTKEKSALVARFRPLVKDLIYKDWMNTDEYLYRWLHARRGNFRAAREMLKTVSKHLIRSIDFAFG